jgi:hypothetical protein
MASDMPSEGAKSIPRAVRSTEQIRLVGWLLIVAVVVELVALRTATRTLVHIPGTERFRVPIRVVAEGGRMAYYLAVVSLVVALAFLAWTGLRSRDPRRAVLGGAVAVFLLAALCGRLGVLSWTTVGWVSLGVLAVVPVAMGRKRRTLPVTFFVASCIVAGVSVLGQAGGSEPSGTRVDLLVWTAEFFLILAGLSAPLLLRRPPSRSGLVAGAAAALVVTAAFTSASSTVAILLLWNVGVPGWLPGVVYAVAVGSLTATAWSAAARGERTVLAGIVLLVAGGVGMISTYQSGLVLMAVLVLGGAADSIFGTGRSIDADLPRAENSRLRPIVPV